MSRINKQLNESNSTIYTPAFVESISKVDIPAGIYLKSADYFDDKYINSTSTVGYSIIQAAAAMPTSDGIKSATN